MNWDNVNTTALVHTTWHTLITAELIAHGETWADVESCTLPDNELHQVFDAGYNGEPRIDLTLWTRKRVYFSLDYDGADSCGSVARHPNLPRVVPPPTEYI